MEMNEQLIQAITKMVVAELKNSGVKTGNDHSVYTAVADYMSGSAAPAGAAGMQGFAGGAYAGNTGSSGAPVSGTQSLAGKTRMRPKRSYAGAVRAKKGTDPKEVVIGVGAAFQREIRNTMGGIPLNEVLANVEAGIEEEGMTYRVVKMLDTSDVCMMGLEAAKLSGSGIGVGIQSKGTTVIHQKDLYPLSNLELFPQAPLMTRETYREIGKNAAKYVKGEMVRPVKCTNDPMTRAKYQIKAALMHIIETEQLEPELGIIEWNG